MGFSGANFVQGGHSGSGGEWVAVEGASMKNRWREAADLLLGIEKAHDFFTSRNGAAGKTAREDFGQGGEIRNHARHGLHPSGVPAEAGNDLIEDEYHFVLFGQRPNAREKAFGQWNRAPGGAGDLTDDSGYVLFFVECLLDLCDVRWADKSFFRTCFEHSHRLKFMKWRLDAESRVIVPTMIVTLEADNF